MVVCYPIFSVLAHFGGSLWVYYALFTCPQIIFIILRSENQPFFKNQFCLVNKFLTCIKFSRFFPVSIIYFLCPMCKIAFKITKDGIFIVYSSFFSLVSIRCIDTLVFVYRKQKIQHSKDADRVPYVGYQGRTVV